MSSRKIANPLIAVLVLGLSAAAYAQQPTKIGVINSQQAFTASAEGKKAQTQLLDQENKIKSDLARLDAEIKTLETKLTTQRMTLSNDAAIQIQSDLERKTTARKRREEDGAREAQQFQISLVQRIRGEMVGIIDGLAKEKGLDLILDLGASGIVFFNPAMDITDEIIRRYDAAKAAAPKK
jgi:Skp family chaperone for outer membrane proteins